MYYISLNVTGSLDTSVDVTHVCIQSPRKFKTWISPGEGYWVDSTQNIPVGSSVSWSRTGLDDNWNPFSSWFFLRPRVDGSRELPDSSRRHKSP